MQDSLKPTPRSSRWLPYGLIIVAIVALIVGFRQPALAETARHYTELEFAPPPEVTLPEYTRFETANGIVVYLVEDHELPLVSGSAMIRTGNRLEPADKTGLAGLVGEVLRSGGTETYPADRLNTLLEQRAASVESGIDATVATVNFDALSEDVDQVFRVFTDLLRHPAFPQDKLELSKTQQQGAIARRNDNPEDVASREFQKLVYGKDSPYARTVEYATLNNISRTDVVEFYQRYFAPQNLLLGIVGDFDPVAMRSLIEETLGDWQASATAKVVTTDDLPTVSQANNGGVFLVDLPQLTQSYVQIGHLGGQFNQPDYAAMSVLNEVMNGFGGRLVNEVRSRQGLAYVIYAFWSPRFDYPGIFVGGGQTRSDATVPFIRSTLAELEEVRTTPISDEELRRAQDSVLNSFIFSFRTPGQILSRLMRYEYYDYPSDFIFQYQQAVAETTPEDVLRAAQTQLKPEDIVTLVVGNAAAIDPPLSTLVEDGTVTAIDVSIPSENP
ncbi:MAG: insulinase family protein [Leptolyngbyaceae cyanobacterium SL_7_1]|nr:insulinase family protein [Leptolyngbyaceae cyanobacterium SL_7_1]